MRVSPEDEAMLRLAIEQARLGIASGQSPFGAVLAQAGRVIAAEHNRVWQTTDPTAHAEVNVIRAAAAKLGRIDLGGTVLYSTCEPCPMCLAAIHWARVDRVAYGAAIADAAAAGFHELKVPAETMVKVGGSPLRLQGGVLLEDCRELFADWKAQARSQAY